MSKKKAKGKPPVPKGLAKALASAAGDGGTFPYVVVSMSVLANHPMSPAARKAVKQRMGLEEHQWVTDDVVVAQAQTTSQVARLFRDLGSINQEHNPYFSAVAILIPNGQIWWLSDVPENIDRIVDITGRRPE